MNTDINIILTVLSAMAVLAGIISLTFGLSPLRRSSRGFQGLKTQVTPPDESNKRPKVSIVFYSPGNEEEMENFLDSLTGQTYDNYEVVCVRETTAETIKDSKGRYEEKYPGLYMTFIPPHSLNLSRRKLAFTIGIKAAKGEIILLTDSECRPDSEYWIEEMASGFNKPGVELVLGYVSYSFTSGGYLKRLYQSFLELCGSTMWISRALKGKAFRGDSANMAFLRNVFMKKGGYTASNFLQSGEDDLFVTEYSDGTNTRIQLNPEARVSVSYTGTEAKHREQKRASLDFMSRYLPRAPFIRAGWASAFQWLTVILYASVIAWSAYLLSTQSDPHHSLLYLGGGILLLLLFWLGDILAYRRAASALGLPRLFFTVPLFMLWKPIGNFIFRLRRRKSKRKNYTWEH